MLDEKVILSCIRKIEAPRSYAAWNRACEPDEVNTLSQSKTIIENDCKTTEYLNWRKPGKALTPKIKSFNKEHYSGIISLDGSVTGEEREKLLQPYLDRSFVFVDDRNVCGFYIPELEESPICAKTVEAGRELMRLKYAKADKAFIPVENRAGIEFIYELGFVEAGMKRNRMALGKRSPGNRT